MKPQIQLSIFLPETIPGDPAFPLTVATLKVIPPGRTSGTSSTFAVALNAEGYEIWQDGERVDPETIDTLPEATARAILGITEFVIPQWLRDHLREYAQQGGLERAFARREGWQGR